MWSCYRRYLKFLIYIWFLQPQLYIFNIVSVWSFQLSVYRESTGIQAVINSNAKKSAEQDENLVKASGVPYSIIRTGVLKNTPGGQQGFCFEEVFLYIISFLHETLWIYIVYLISFLLWSHFLLVNVKRILSWDQDKRRSNR